MRLLIAIVLPLVCLALAWLGVTRQSQQSLGKSSAAAAQQHIAPAMIRPDDFRATADAVDDAPSIQRAIDTLCRGTGNTLHWLPRHYVIASPIVQDCALTWRGEGWQEAPPDIATARGTWLDIRGRDFKPVTIRGRAAKGSEIHDIAVDQPAQPAPPEQGPWAPADYPHVFNVENVEGYVGFRHIFMDGVTNGIRSFNGGRTVVDGLWGQFFDNDVTYDKEYDVTRLYELHSWPYWSSSAPVIAYQQAHHQAIVLGRADSPFLDRLFVFAAASALQIQAGAEGGTATGVQVGIISCDSVVSCVRDDSSGTDLAIGELRQFGQSGVADAIPSVDATALLINGQGLFRIGVLSVKMIDVAPIVATNAAACSVVLVSELDVDFTWSTRNTALLQAKLCSATGEVTRAVLAMAPLIAGAHKGRFANTIGGRVSWPDAISH